MKTLIGKAICWLLRRHEWRRLRKAEGRDPRFKICDRCGHRHTVKMKVVKS